MLQTAAATMESLRFQKFVLKLVKIFYEQLNKLILNVLISSEIDEVKLNNNTSESISILFG
jgi:hypothetical protein